MTPYQTFAILFNAGITLCILSFLYKESHAYRFAEHLFLGTFAGQTLYFAVTSIVDTCVVKIFNGVWIYLIPFILGFLLYTGMFFVPASVKWISRYPLVIIVATTLGIEARAQILTYFFTNVRQSLLNVVDLSNLVLVLGVITTAFYFFFTFKKVVHPQVDKYVRNIGQIFIMVYFGVSFGTTTMGRLSQMISRLDFLLHEWPAPLMIPIAIIVGLVAWFLGRKKS